MSHFTVLIATFLLTATMAGDQAKPAGKPGAKPAAKPAAVTAALQGTWVIATINGQAPPAEMTLTFTGEKYHQTVDGQVNERGTIKVDGSKKPMTIDLLITEGDDAKKTQLGIFEVTGDSLKAGFATPGATERPTDFSGTVGFVAVMKKQKKG